MASQKDLQESILDSIQIMIDQAINDTAFTSSSVGRVKSVNGVDCIVEINGDDFEVRMFEHLRGQIWEGDIVVVQDLYNSSFRRFIQSKIGSVSS